MDSNLELVTLHTKLLEVILNSKRNFVVMGQLLHELKEEDNFKLVIGEGIDTWNDYISQPEIGLSKAEADRLIQIYEQFVLRFGISPEELATVPVKNIHYLLPIIKEMDETEENSVEAYLADARELSQKDFRERVHDIKSGEDGLRTYEYVVMRKCLETGGLQKVHGIDSETIRQTFNLYNDD